MVEKEDMQRRKSSVQSTQSWPTLCNPMDYSKPGFPVHHQLTDLLRLMSMESVMQSNYLILCCPLLLLPLIFPSIRVFFSETVIRIRWPVYWSFSFSMRPSNEYSGLTGLISLQSKGLSRVFSNTTVQKHQFFGTAFFIFQLSYPYMTTGKTIALTTWTLVTKVMSLLFNILSRFVNSFSSKEQAFFNIMATATICSDFEAQENSLSLFPLFPHLFAMEWWDRIPRSLCFECWVLSQLFHSHFHEEAL